jgi:superfamily II DNA or RNA helicase
MLTEIKKAVLDASGSAIRNFIALDKRLNNSIAYIPLLLKVSEMLTRRKIDHVLAHGKIKKKDSENVMQRIKSSKLTVGTTSLLGEGLDVSVWGTLIMGTPISSEIKLMQAIGRIVRPSKGKEKALVYDLKDSCGFSGSSFNKRLEIYRKNNILVFFERSK